MRYALLLLLVACPAPPKKPLERLDDPAALGDRDSSSDLVAELQDDILKSYERDEPPDYENALVPAEVGTLRIGVGPGDVLIGSELARAPSRWPLDLDQSGSAEPRSKRLEIHLSQDRLAAWANDEISWRIHLCGRTAVIPLRMTALFARDGDRWVPVFEHLSFARPPMPTGQGQKPPREIRTAVVSRDLVDELSRVLSPVLRRAGARPSTGTRSAVASRGGSTDKAPQGMAADATLYGPDVASEWRGAEAIGARLMIGSEPMKLEDRRVGVVGRNPRTANLAYWAGNLTADLPGRPGIAAGKGHFRATFVFEKRQNEWVIVQGHVSQPIDDDNLGFSVFGTALISPKPLAISCDDRTNKR